MNYLIFFSRTTLLVVFLAALTSKLRNRDAWAQFVSATGTLLATRHTARLWAVAAAVLEASTAMCLLVDPLAYDGFLIAIVVLATFSVVVALAIRRGVQTGCNCFGSEGDPLDWRHVWRNLCLVLVAAVGAVGASRYPIPTFLARSAYATSILLSAIAAAVFIMWDDVSHLIVGPPS